MKKSILASVVTISLILPAGFIFAKDDGNREKVKERAEVRAGILHRMESNLEFLTGRPRGREDSEDVEIEATTSAHIDDDRDDDSYRGASSSPWLRGEKRGLIRHFGTTTPPGIERRHTTSTVEGATTTLEKKVWIGAGGGMSVFLRWLFALPATTTIGEIRTQLVASTTASTTVQISPFGGFWRNFIERVFDLFRLNGED